jgi:DNA polymerase, archaea type
LTYDGKLIIRGSGLHSSSAPEFAACFLSDALAHLLHGDLVTVVGLYQATLRALRERKYPTATVAVNTQLTKSSDEYQRSRGRLKEGQYECLLAAGREQWQAGERVRYYRARGGRYVWLPYELDDLDDSVGGVDMLSVLSAVAQPAGEDRRDYDVGYYSRLLHDSYAKRLRKAYREADFARLFRMRPQPGLYERWMTTAQAHWIEAAGPR